MTASVPGLSRRDFLCASGIGGLAIAGLGAAGSVRRAEAAEVPGTPDPARIKTVCPFCSVGCSIWAEVENGVWVGQEPVFESPINQGTHCCKGASAREMSIGERRTKYPMKKVGGAWQRISWEQAIQEISGEFLRIREQYGPESVHWIGSAKFSNEAAYLFRKFAAFWGTNNTDHQARICHSTTVAGVANIHGYGAMTNSYNDIRNSKSIIIFGGNPAEAHPVSMLHVLGAHENGARMIVVDPRFTRTAAHADEYVRIRPGTDVAMIWGLARIALENGWEDKDYLARRVWGFDRCRDEINRWTPEEVERVTGVPPEQLQRVARTLAENRPGTLIWCMGLTQFSMGNNKTRAATILQLVLGNTGKSGGGANIFRGHDNVQGATDMCVVNDSLPAYYGLSEGAWKHWANVWGVKYDWLRGRFTSKELMEAPGMPVSRWMDGVLESGEALDQPNPTKAVVFWGHATNSQTRGPDRQKALAAAELIVVVDPYPTQTAVETDRPDGLYLLPAGSTLEAAGSVTNSNRSLQWREKVVEPVFEAKSDYEIMYLLANALGFGKEMFQYIAVEDGVPSAEDLLRELNLGSWSIGYTGQSPERLKLHMQHQDKFDGLTLRGMAEPVLGDTYCLPWPCWGNADLGHPGTHILYDISKPVAEGGLPFRARWGVEHEGENLLAENSFPVGSEIEDGYPEMTMAMLDALGWANELTPREMLVIAAIGAGSFSREMLAADEARATQLMGEMEAAARDGTLGGGGAEHPKAESWESAAQNAQESAAGDDLAGIMKRFPEYPPLAIKAIVAYLAHNIQETPPAGELSVRDKILRVSWKTDLSGGIQRVAIAHGLAPYGNGKARCFVWNFPDPVPLHREPLYTPRRDLLPEYRTWDDKHFFRLPVLFWSIQQKDFSAEFPLVLTSGRLVEYEGGGDETRSNPWLAEFQQQMFAEINPADAANAGVDDNAFVWIRTPEGGVRVMALVTNRVGPGTVFMPFHFAGMWMGQDLSGRYPAGAMPFVIGEATNTVQTYGYDAVTQMQETKATLCRIEPA